MCTVSVILPIYNSEKYLRESVESVLHQTYADWELLAIVEYGTTDCSAKIIQEYAKRDPRIKLFQNTERLGLADSLNKGFRLAKGKYLARLDADDLAAPERFEKQVRYLEKHKNVGILGTWQHHIGKDIDWVHKPPVTPVQCKAGMLFGCDLCHSTLMLRKSTVMKHRLFYDNSYLAEDYELWLRALCVTDIANIPEVLGTYRVGEDNITNAKKEKLNIESGYLVARTLKTNLGYTVPKNRIWFFRGWENPFFAYSLPERRKYYREFEHILKQIIKANQKVGFYKEQELLRVIDAKWRWANYGTGWNEKREISSIQEVFSKRSLPDISKAFARRMLRKPYEMVRRRTVDVLLRQMWEVEGNLHRNLAATMDGTVDRLSEQIAAAEERIRRNVAEERIRMNAAEELKILMQTVDGRIRKAEQNITQTMDGRIWKAEQNITQTVDGRIWKAQQEIVRMQTLLTELCFQFQQPGKKIVMINTPSHDNLGDHAIAYAEQMWAMKQESYDFIEIAGEEYRQCRSVIHRLVSADDVIAISGGGFLGTLWPHEQELVEQVITDFPQNRIRIFPQSVYFSDDEDGRKACGQAYDVFKNHRDLVIFVRESISYNFLETQMPACRTVLACDMALYFLLDNKNWLLKNAEKSSVGICLKNDKESVLDSEARNELIRMITEMGKAYVSTDMLLEHEIDVNERKKEIQKKVTEFASYEVVITDRFHGIIFSLLARTRCIALRGVSHKNKGLCDLLSDAGIVSYAQDIREVRKLLEADSVCDETRMEQLIGALEKSFGMIDTYF